MSRPSPSLRPSRRAAAGAVLVVACTALAAACGDDRTVGPANCRVVVSEPGALVAGTAVPLASTVDCPPLPNARLEWTTADARVATVDATGRLTAVAPGETTVEARVAGVSGVVARQPVRVTPCRPVIVPATGASFSLVPGASMQVRVVVGGCPIGSPADTAVVFTSSDTSAATVDARGLVTARFITTARVVSIVAALARDPQVRTTMTANVYPVEPWPVSVVVLPQKVDAAPFDTVRLRAVATLGTTIGAPVAFHSRDSCVARVSADGLVTAILPGRTLVAVFPVAAPTVTQFVPVEVRGPTRGERVQHVEVAADGVPIAENAGAPVRGVLTVTYVAERWVLPQGGRVTVVLAGQPAGVAVLPPAAPGGGARRVSLKIDTAERDAVGAARFPNGARLLEVRAESTGAGTLPGCVSADAGVVVAGVSRTVTLANP